MGVYITLHAKHSTVTLLGGMDTITIQRLCRHVRVINRGSLGPIYVTTDGSIPAVGDDGCFVVASGQSRALPVMMPSGENPVVKVISAVTADYSVEPILNEKST